MHWGQAMTMYAHGCLYVSATRSNFTEEHGQQSLVMQSGRYAGLFCSGGDVEHATVWNGQCPYIGRK